MKKFWLFLKSTYRNVILKRKLKPFLMLLTDAEFRASINKMYELTRNCSRIDIVEVRLGDIGFGHKIVYPEYVKTLSPDVYALPRIKVCREGVGYRVIDGNHRLACFKRWCSPDQIVPVDLLS